MKTQHAILEASISIALNAHKGKVDKGEMPYILHPLRVMQSVDSIDEKIVAVLHDVVEDTDTTFRDLEVRGVPLHCIEALKLLTHEKGVPYMDYIKEIASNKLATAVKLADLNDNIDLSRLKKVTDKDIERVEKYRKAIEYLLNKE